MPPGIKGVYNLHKYDQERRLWLAKIDERWEALAAETAPLVAALSKT